MRFITRLFHLLSPESAHGVVIRLLRLNQWWHFRLWRKRWEPKPFLHFSKLPGLTFNSRLGLAAGFDKNAEVFPALARCGFGFLEVGTVTPLPQPGNPKPRIFRVKPNALVNCLGFNNHGLKVFRENLRKWRGVLGGVPIFANLGKGRDTALEDALQDYGASLRELSGVVDGFVINISSPNTPGLTGLQNAKFLEGLGSLVPSGKPIWIKLSPDLETGEFEELARWVDQSSFCQGIVLTNTSPLLAKKIAGRDQGGLSGGPLFETSLDRVERARRLIREPKLVVGVGGISSVEQAKQMCRAGADLVEVYTSFIYQGPSLIRELAEALHS